MGDSRQGGPERAARIAEWSRTWFGDRTEGAGWMLEEPGRLSTPLAFWSLLGTTQRGTGQRTLIPRPVSRREPSVSSSHQRAEYLRKRSDCCRSVIN